MARRPARQESFVVRIWREAHRSGWYAWVQRTRSGETAVVRTVPELLAFLDLLDGKVDELPPQGLK